MKPSRLLMCLLVMLVCIPLHAAGSASVKGRVVDVSGKPLVGIRVYAVYGQLISDIDEVSDIRWDCSVKAMVITDDDGNYVMEKLPKTAKHCSYKIISFSPGQYLGWVEGKGPLASGGATTSKIAPDAYNIMAHKIVEIRGRVINEQGIGIEGAKVKAEMFLLLSDFKFIALDFLSPIMQLIPAISDNQGYFVLAGVPEGVQVSAVVEKSGYADVTVDPQSNQQRITMVRSGSISGSIHESHNKPLTGVRIVVQSEDEDILQITRTDRNGFYQFSGLAPDSYYIATKDEEKPIISPKVIVIAGKDTQVPPLKVLDGVEISGCIIDAESGEPISDAQLVFIGTKDGNNWLSRTDETDEDGIFYARVYPGKINYQIDCYNPRYRISPGLHTITIPESGTDDITIRLPREDTAKGVILDSSGKSVSKANVTVIINGYPTWISATSNTKGSFEISIPSNTTSYGGGEKMGAVVLKAIDAKMTNGCFLKMDRAELLKKPVLITLKPAAQLSVMVRDSEGNNPLQGVQVSISNSNEYLVKKYNTDQKGVATCLDSILRDAKYSVGLRKEGYYFEPVSFPLPEVGSSEWKNSIELQMVNATHTQKGSVVFPDGQPASYVTVRHIDRKFVKTDDNGEFIISGLPDGNVDLIVKTKDSTGSAQVNKDSGDVVITLKSIDRMETTEK